MIENSRILHTKPDELAHPLTHYNEDKTMTTINNNQDIIDSRDVIARIEQLADERQTLADELDDIETQTADIDPNDPADFGRLHELADLKNATAALKDWDAENGEELRILKELQEEAEGYASDWIRSC